MRSNSCAHRVSLSVVVGMSKPAILPAEGQGRAVQDREYEHLALHLLSLAKFHLGIQA
jgi:hypothetical protein